MGLTQEQIESANRNEQIPTEEIQNDILATEQEISVLEDEIVHLEATPHTSSALKINFFRASAKRSGIKERKLFIEKLKAILEYRATVKA